VTGAAGFIGGHLVERLVASGHTVRAVDCLTPYYDVRQKRETLALLEGLPGCTVRTDDLRVADLDVLLDGVDVVFHQAGQPGVRASWDAFESYVEHNVLVTHRLLDAATRAGLRRFVYASSSSVYGDRAAYPTTEDDLPAPQSPYGVSKLAAEHLCGVYGRTFGVPTVSLRYFTVYGPRQRPDMAMHRLVEAAISGEPFPMFGDGSQVRDFTYVGDVVEANVLAAEAPLPPGTIVNVAGGSSVDLRSVVRLVGSIVGRPIALEPQPAQPGDVARTGGAIDRARERLGWAPHVPLEEGLVAQATWHAQRRALEPAR
jgi:nucleoside-diphosphate-sugar epimerase